MVIVIHIIIMKYEQYSDSDCRQIEANRLLRYDNIEFGVLLFHTLV